MAIIKNKFAGKIEAGVNNTSSGDYSSSIAGQNNCATGVYSVIAGGCGNQATGYGSFVGGGLGNTACGDNSSVIAGSNNLVSGSRSVAFGSFNTVSGGSSIIGGNSNTGNNESLTIGNLNIAGSRGIAAGYNSCSTGGHGIAIGWNTRATGSTSSAFNGGNASGSYSFAINSSIASGCDSFSANGGSAGGFCSSAFGNGGYSYNASQLSTGDRITYGGDSQFSILTKKLNTGQVSSGGTYSFGGFQFRNNTFGSGVDQMYYLTVKVLIAPRLLTGTVTGLVRGDLYTAEYTLAANVSTFSPNNRIIGTPQLERSFSDPNMSTTAVAFTMDGTGDIIVSLTPPTWGGEGTLEFRGTMTIESSELGLYA